MYLFYSLSLKGSSIHASEVVQGLVFKRHVETAIIKKMNAKIAVFTCPLDVTQTETKVNKVYVK